MAPQDEDRKAFYELKREMKLQEQLVNKALAEKVEGIINGSFPAWGGGLGLKPFRPLRTKRA
jgi:hypothetical protein